MATTPPSSDPQVTQPSTKIVGSVNQAVLQQANPTVASAYTSDFVAEKNEIIATQVKQLEATQGSPVTERQLAGIAVYADAPARAIVNNKYQNEIEEARAAQSVPANTPPPTIAPADVNVTALPNDVDPNFISNPGPVDNTIDPETPQPTVDVGVGKKSFVPIAVDNTTEPGSTSTGFDDFYGDQTFTPSRTGTADAVPVAPNNTGFDDYYGEQTFTPSRTGTADAVPTSDTGFDDFYGEQTFTANRTGTADAVPVAPTNTGFDNYYGEITDTVNRTGTADAVPVAPTNTGFDDYYGEQTYTVNYTGTADVVPTSDTGFDDFYGEQTYTVNYTGTADAVPAGNTGFDDFYGEQTYTANRTGTADAVPVSPAANPQVPNIFSSIGALLSSLFGIRPTPVSPAANPQVAQAFPVPAPTVFTPTPIPPVSNPQVAQPPIVQNFFTDRTPAPVAPTVNPQVPAAQDFGSEPPIGLPPPQDFGSDPQIGLPPAQDFGSEPPIVVPAAQDYGSDPQIGLPPAQDFGGRKKADPDIVDSPAEPAVQAQAETRIDGPVNQALLQQSNPAVATDYKSYVVDTQNKIVEQQTRELEVTQGFPASENQIAVINGEAFGTATIAANVRFKNQIESADAAQSVPANTPPPTIAPADVNVPALPNDVDPNFITNTAPVDNTIEPQAAQVDEALVAARAIDPNFIPLNDVSATTNPQVPSSANTRVENVNQSVLAQKDPALYQQWQGTFAARTEQNTARAIAAEEAVQGRPVTAEEKASIAGFSAFQARNETNAIYKDELQAANAVSVVPVDTPPPTVAAPAVSPDSNAQVPNTPTKVVAVSTETLLQNDPQTAQEYTAFKNETATQLTEQRIAEREAVEGGPISVSEQVQIAARSERDATTDANIRYQDQIEAAGAATVVPADTPPPTVQPVAVTDNPQVVVPPTKIVAVSSETLLQNDPTTAQEYTAFKNETAQELTTQRIAEREAVEGGEISVSEQVQIAARAEVDATADANFRYQDQIQAAGAATVVPADTPPPTVIPPAQDFGVDPQVPAAQDFGQDPPIVVPLAQDFGVDPQVPAAQDFGVDPPIVVPAAQDFGTDPQIGLPPAQDFGSEPPLRAPAPPSPSPYERFIAEENAATDAAQAEATARFNAQFDVVTEDPQVPLAQDFGSEPPIEVPLAQDFGVDPQAQDFGTDADFNIGEFQSEPVDIPTIDTGYDDFYGNQEDVGEFQAEPELVADAQDYGVDNADPLGDFIGDLQSEPSDGDGESAGFGDFFGDVAAGTGSFFKSFAGAVSGAVDPQANSAQQSALDSISGLIKSAIKTPNQLAAERQAAAKAQAKAQAQVNAQRKQANDGDWRVRLRLAGGADYLYKAKGANGKSAAGILEPLAVTDGVIFPYTPQITTQYQAKYNPYELTHSNYKGYFYQGSSVNEISITATFTAQDTSEANYLLAVIHFFRSVTKMFYGQDDASKRGAPPPLVFLQGLGEYQFNLHPCVVSTFDYTLPNDVDYIRANSVNFNGTNLLQRRDLQNLPIDYVNSVSSRLSNAGLTKGGLNTPPPPPTLGTNSPTYVPTKMEIRLVLLPMQTRSQVSQQFSLKQFASGDLIRGGFW